MDRLPKYLHTLWFEELEDFSIAEQVKDSNRRFRHSAGQSKTETFSLDLTKIPEWLQDYADKFRGLHISTDDPNWAEMIVCSKAGDKPSLTVPVFNGKETFTEGTALLAKETPDPYGMGC